jgi:hypothetical protein
LIRLFDLHSTADFLYRFQRLEAMIDLALGYVSNRRQFGVVIGVQSLRRCPGTAATAAD